MQTPKNNLKEVLVKKTTTNPSSLSFPSAASSSSKKFTPARIESGSNISPLSELPTFSTVGFRHGQLAVKQAEKAASSVSTWKASASSPTNTKRTSPDTSIISNSPPKPPKRPKTDTKAEKENHFVPKVNTPLKEKSFLQSTRIHHAVVTSEESRFNTYLKTNRPTTEEPIIGCLPHDTQTDDILQTLPELDQDLLSKDLGALNALLIDNYEVRCMLTEKELAYHRGAAVNSDITMYQRLIKSLSDRMASIKKAISFREKGTQEPPMRQRLEAINVSLSEFITPEPKEAQSNSTLQAKISESTIHHHSFSATAGSQKIYENSKVILDEDDPMPGSEADYWSGLPDAPIDDPLSELSYTSISATPSLLASSCTSITSISSSLHREITEKLGSVFGLHTFRRNQLEAITEALNGRDVFVLMPTGGGKSLCYQLPAVCQNGRTKGVTIVVSPLLALMKDQVDSLMKKKVDVFLWNSEAAYEDAINRMRGTKKPTLVYITPEKLKESSVAQRILGGLYRDNELARFVIDEAHCISTWGQDFREAYRHLGTLRSQFPNVPIMALTATARRITVADIKERLNLRNCAFFSQSFNRPNLKYEIVPKPKKGLEAMIAFIKSKHLGKSGVVYCLGRGQCEELARKLTDKGLSAKHFHAGMPQNEKDQTLDEWRRDKVHIIVATIAFGMGIDKANVRFVIHWSIPKSLDGYYQETGRAGRDGRAADCVLYFHFKDFKAVQNMIERPDVNNVSPSRESIERQNSALRAVMEYCLNISECRRVQLLQYFDEKFDRSDCANACDNCSNPNPLTTVNLSTKAADAVQLVESFQLRSDLLTLAQCRNILKGANIAEVRNKGYDKDPKFGSARDLPPELVNQLLQKLCVMGVLTEESIQQPSGYHIDYVKLGPKSTEFKHRKEALKVDWRPKAGKMAGKTPNHQTTRPPETKRTNSTGKLKVTDTDPIEVYDEDSLSIESENEGEIEAYAVRSSKSLAMRSTSTPGGGIVRQGIGNSIAKNLVPNHTNVAVPDPAELYGQMSDLRDKICQQEGIFDPEEVFNDTTLQLLSVTCPQDHIIFKQELGDDMDEAAVAAKFEKYGRKFLDLCNRHRLYPHAPPTNDYHIEDLRPRFAYQKNPIPPSAPKRAG